MIQYITGNLLESEAQALVNTVNTVGVMGKGIALQFKTQFPNNTRAYEKACKSGAIAVGKPLVTEDHSLLYGKKIIINFPTKTDWRKPSEYNYIAEGLTALKAIIVENQISSIAIPPLGAGNGGLDWNKVRPMIEAALADVDAHILIYQPNTVIKEVLRKERIALTPARAMLLAVLYEVVRNGEFVSEFAAEKVCYFLQRFGAEKQFSLNFQPNFYGPYSGKVRHVLFSLNGSYLTGYADKDKKPFDPLNLMLDAEADVLAYLNAPERTNERAITQQTISFLNGYCGDLALELLSTLDFLLQRDTQRDIPHLQQQITTWNSQKSKRIGETSLIEKGLHKLASAGLI